MVKTQKIITAFIVLLLLTCLSYSQKSVQEIKQKEKELQKLRSDIKLYEKKLKESEKIEKSTLERLDDIENQTALIKQLILEYKKEEAQITLEIDTTKSTIEMLEQQLVYLKTQYANYVCALYKKSKVYDLELLFSSKSINQFYIRLKYLKKFSEQRIKDLQKILSHKTILEQNNKILLQKLNTEKQLLEEKKLEEEKLKKIYSQRQKLLSNIRKDKKNYKRELSRKMSAYQQIEQLIASLIEKEQIRKEKEEAEKKEREIAEAKKREQSQQEKRSIIPIDNYESNNILKYKGRLPWPVKNGTIQSRFGKQIHPILKTETQNTGIDIATTSGTNVITVADGEVVVSSYIAGFGNILIINHYNGYRTVYAHLSDITVKESEKVKEGQVIAKSGDTITGSILHFEIWKDKEKQNPEHWLIKRK